MDTFFLFSPLKKEVCDKKKEMAKLTREQKRDYARRLFTGEEGITQKEIAKRVGVTEATVSRWKEQERWDDLKINLCMMRDEMLASMYRQLKELIDEIEDREEGKRYPSSRETDAMRKLTASIKALEVELSVAEKMEVCRQFLTFARQVESPDLCREMAIVVNKFIRFSLK